LTDPLLPSSLDIEKVNLTYVSLHQHRMHTLRPVIVLQFVESAMYAIGDLGVFHVLAKEAPLRLLCKHYTSNHLDSMLL
jgi:hypothetical protein